MAPSGEIIYHYMETMLLGSCYRYAALSSPYPTPPSHNNNNNFTRSL